MTFFGRPTFTVRSPQAYYAAADDAGDDAYYYAAAGDDVSGPRGEIETFLRDTDLAFVWASFRRPNGRPDGLST